MTQPRLIYFALIIGFILAIVLALYSVGGKLIKSNPDLFEQGLSKKNYPLYLKTNFGKFDIIVADDSIGREKGLGQIDSLPENKIMLFIFDHSDMYGFWMRDMKFNIDIIWLDESYEVVDILENVSPKTYPKIFFPARQALYVVEANANFVRNNSIKIGQKLFFTK